MSFGPYGFSKPAWFLCLKSLLGLMALFLGCYLCSNLAQARAPDPNEEKTDKKAEDEEPTAEPPEAEEIDLAADDGMQIKATYFPGVASKKVPENEIIPVILLHGFKGSRKDFTDKDVGLASILQKTLGCAVIAPDLRGHGDSSKIKKGKQLVKPTPRELLPASMKQDLLAIKGFLWNKNNEKKLNIDKLVVIGVEEGAAVALAYADADADGYEQGYARVGPLRLGRFVKAAVLISPVKVTSLNTMQVMKRQEICRDLPVMIAVGNKNKQYLQEADLLRKMFVRERPPVDDDKPESATVWFFKKIDTPLQGAKLLAEPSLKLPDKIREFLKARLVANEDAKEWVWKERKLPHE